MTCSTRARLKQHACQRSSGLLGIFRRSGTILVRPSFTNDGDHCCHIPHGIPHFRRIQCCIPITIVVVSRPFSEVLTTKERWQNTFSRARQRFRPAPSGWRFMAVWSVLISSTAHDSSTVSHPRRPGGVRPRSMNSERFAKHIPGVIFPVGNRHPHR